MNIKSNDHSHTFRYFFYLQAFSVFAEARKEDILKRTKLLSFYKNFEDVLKNCDEKLQESLSRKIDIVKEVEQKRKNLEVEEYVVLVAGKLTPIIKITIRAVEKFHGDRSKLFCGALNIFFSRS